MSDAQIRSRICAVCEKEVRREDEAEHLRTYHLGPHYFYLNAVECRTEEPSMTVREIYQKFYGGVPIVGQLVEDRDGKWIYYSLTDAVDLTHRPHLFHLLPATGSSIGEFNL